MCHAVRLAEGVWLVAKGRKTGGGSRKGCPNKHPGSFREALRQYCASIGVDPHKFMADIIADANLDNMVLKFNAARELAKYLEPQLRAIELSGEVDHNVTVIHHRYGPVPQKE
jgi:hypothetical protein